MQTSSLRARLLALFARHRRRLATLVLGLFLVAVALEIGGSLPRETRVSVPLGPRARRGHRGAHRRRAGRRDGSVAHRAGARARLPRCATPST
ncbi:MAG: hypothetical protein M5U28_52415 [Sandaracinaceae bacterium]|nr:hypothetical protein [Sandaracinaceae bacterium]